MPAENGLTLSADLRGLDALEIPRVEPDRPLQRVWRAGWPKAAAVAIGLLVWQLVVVSGWKPAYVLPPPTRVLGRLAEQVGTGEFWQAVAITMQRAAFGFALALGLGTTLGLAVSQSRIVRSAVGSLISGVQSMPSIVWFPFAILLFGLSETAILFVIVLGAAPAIANGLIAGIDHIPPILLRAGRVLGARGPDSWRHVVLPAALPGYLAGLKQGWAFAWRSLMAGELLVVIAERPSIGVRLQFARELSDAAGLQAMMIVVLVIGLLVDGLFFGTLERIIRRNRGLVTVR
ncbi:MAG: ABC transporter permease [Actinobacteria bacterium]|nr:ABC transporter permease [Actinomycetota bacterium]MBU1493651.1 ABC transporter permease [Actinomycetota bacterium]MBU1865206.1 ABC transporter permease [Actinomycetota bacterium]